MASYGGIIGKYLSWDLSPSHLTAEHKFPTTTLCDLNWNQGRPQGNPELLVILGDELLAGSAKGRENLEART